MVRQSIGLLCATTLTLCWAAAQSPDVAIVGALDDGTTALSPESAPVRQLKIQETLVHQINDGKITIHRVLNPDSGLAPPPLIAESQTASQALVPESGDSAVSLPQPFFIAATIVNDGVTFLRWSYEGHEFRAWSNIDFRYLSGFSRFRRGPKHYAPIVAVGEVLPDAPVQALPANFPAPGAPGFVIVKGDPANSDAAEAVDALHDLYHAEQSRLRQAYHLREQRKQEREAQKQTDPAPSKDIVLRYWVRRSAPKK